MEHDKYKSCEGCPERCADPNCHDNCVGYKRRCEEAEKVNAARREMADYISASCDAFERSKSKVSFRNLLRRRNDR